jgi:hypothetical protein
MSVEDIRMMEASLVLLWVWLLRMSTDLRWRPSLTISFIDLFMTNQTGMIYNRPIMRNAYVTCIINTIDNLDKTILFVILS